MEMRWCILDGLPVLPHRLLHDVTVRPKLFSCMLEVQAVLLYGLEHNLMISSQSGGHPAEDARHGALADDLEHEVAVAPVPGLDRVRVAVDG